MFVILHIIYVHVPFNVFYVLFLLVQKRQSALKRMEEFLSRTESSNYVLPSSKLLFMSTCMAHKIHYSVSHNNRLLAISTLVGITTTSVFSRRNRVLYMFIWYAKNLLKVTS